MDQTLPILTRDIARTLEQLDASLDPAARDSGGLRRQAERFSDLMIDALFPRFSFDRTSRESRLLQAAGLLEDCLSHIPDSPPLETVFASLLQGLPEIRRQLQTDLIAAYRGDPAAKRSTRSSSAIRPLRRSAPTVWLTSSTGRAYRCCRA